MYQARNKQNKNVWKNRSFEVRYNFQFDLCHCVCMYIIYFSGLFFEKHLKYIKLNGLFVPFTKMDLNYLLKVSFRKLPFKMSE